MWIIYLRTGQGQVAPVVWYGMSNDDKVVNIIFEFVRPTVLWIKTSDVVILLPISLTGSVRTDLSGRQINHIPSALLKIGDKQLSHNQEITT